ncbi:hypothetical protein M0802_001450 [Mischocyttarus mexicanus]|nr:hypothetical protein M0802_001450 [Mischocyttarus mexicanus]
MITYYDNKLQTIGEDFCGLDVNTPLGGEDPIAAFPVLTFDTLLTAVAATSTGDYTVVFLGTHKGHLKKVGNRDYNARVLLGLEDTTSKRVYDERGLSATNGLSPVISAIASENSMLSAAGMLGKSWLTGLRIYTLESSKRNVKTFSQMFHYISTKRWSSPIHSTYLPYWKY